MGSKLYSFLERKPENYDIAFCIGPEKTIVKALKVVLKASSPVLEKECDSKWEKQIKAGNGIIPLPRFEPATFKLFIKLLFLDAWSFEYLKDLNLPAEQLLGLLSICRQFGIQNGIESLKELTKEFASSFPAFIKTSSFLRMSQSNLEAIISSDDLNLEETNIFDAVCRWAERQCNTNGLEKTGENIRKVLGNCIFQIRFPIMSFPDFTKAMKIKGILTSDECVRVYEYIGLDDKEKINYKTDQIIFNTNRRMINSKMNPQIPDECTTISLASVFDTVDTPAFVCDGSQKYNYIQSEQDISIHGFGFLGPIDSDSFYDVTIEIKRRINRKEKEFTNKFEQRIFARMGEKIYFIFDQPILFDSISDASWGNCYKIYYSLQGPDTLALNSDSSEQTLEANGSKFALCWSSQQLVEIIFKAL